MMVEPERWLDQAQAAKRLGVTVEGVRRMTRAKWIPATQSVDRGLLYSSYALAAYEDSIRKSVESVAA